MWLLDTVTLRLEEFIGDPPRYAILSHRWEERQEVGFGHVTSSSAHLSGYAKIKGFCLKAQHAGFQYGWVDTCCIDKKSSAELSEAINSMFAWYRDAGICFVYLSDVGDSGDFGASSWFTRGWTLQELLAPDKVQFFDKYWTPLGSKRELVTDISMITGVPEKALQSFQTDDYCVAYKMSWAANRRTTRKEDRAYSLLGIFNTNMPLLYGEGDRAFERLQEEIMRASSDASIFFWQGHASGRSSMLARWPSCFSAVIDTAQAYNGHFRLPFGWTLTNAGLTIPNARLRPYLMLGGGVQIYVLLIAGGRFYPPANRHIKFLTEHVWGKRKEKGALGVLIIEDFLGTWRRVEVNEQTSVVDRRGFVDMEDGQQDVNISHGPLLDYIVSEHQEFPVVIKIRGNLGGLMPTSAHVKMIALRSRTGL